LINQGVTGTEIAVGYAKEGELPFSKTSIQSLMMSPKELEKETTKPAQDQCDTDAIIQGHDCHESKLDEMDIRVKPWKYIGYKGYSDFISSDDDFFILRRFDSLNTRIALLLQDQVSSLEEQLSKLDNSLSCRECEDTNNGTFRDDIEERATLLDAIVGKLRQYSKYAVFY
jgi:hypothetical protein